MCVPMWTVVEIFDRLQISPCARCSICSCRNASSPGQLTMPLYRGTEMSIHSLMGNRDDVLDSAALTRERLQRIFDGVAPGDDSFHSARPALHENVHVSNRRRETLGRGIDRAVDELIVQNHVAHDEIGVHRDRSFAARNCRADDNAVRAW